MTASIETIAYRNHYGAVETNGLPAGGQQELLDSLTGEVYWSDPQLARVFRLRLLTDPGFPMYDVSYCYGTLRNGDNVRVSLPFHQLRKRTWKSDIIDAAKRDGVYAKGLHIMDDDVVSILR
jgi:hypothetical protein